MGVWVGNMIYLKLAFIFVLPADWVASHAGAPLNRKVPGIPQ